MGKALPGGVPAPKRGRSGVVPGTVLGWFGFVARDGQARWTGELDRSPGRGIMS